MSHDRVYRVTVRGRFGELSEVAREYLVRYVADHDIFKSAYTAEGTFTYDHHVDFFNLRYEIRIDGDADEAGEQGRAEAEIFLSAMGFAHRGVKVTVVDVSSVWG